ncbi:DUF192 domain-containing protein [Mesonia aquimarina]|uniref:DUF192 domain-containing protein n=1 Tax=Mesonia aquimarina TaxID=1504967 RepID=UPI000EF5CB68|nr:DUF192 domain-containing protein [Mesonia aquimarina]
MYKKCFTVLCFVGILAMCNISCKNNTDKNLKKVTTKQPSFKKEGTLLFLNKSNDTIANIAIEIADNSYEHQTGLMYRKSMKEDRGMLFIYSEELARPNFYMKNTYIPLDLIYINSANKIVDINRNAKPMDESPIPSEAASQYVLEVNAGMADQWKISLGDRAIFNRE